MKDSNGNSISGAIIELYDEDEVLKSVSTDENGEYVISEIEVGTYDIEGMKSGYDNNKKTDQNLVVGENTINFVFTPENIAPHAEFKISPKNPSAGKKISFKDSSGVLAAAIYYGVILGFIMPIIYHELLPPAIEWFPKEFLEIRQARIELILREILELSELPSQKGLPP